jgi:CHAD domain-containing protein
VAETELLLPDGISADRAIDRLPVAMDGVHIEGTDRGVEESDRVFYDTFDGRLRAAGASAVHEHGRFGFGALTVEATRPPRRVLATGLEPGPLRDALAPIVDVRALLPLAHLHVRERHLRVLDDEHKTVVRLTLEEPTVVGSDERRTELPPRVRLVAVRGYDAWLERVRRALEYQLGFERAAATLVDEAVSAAGGRPGGVSSKISVPLSFNERADRAVAAVLRALLDVIRANLAGTIDDLDTEFLHDLRVAVRRSRSVQRQFRHVFGPAVLEHYRAEFRWLQQLTGDARDLDVWVLEFGDMRELVPEEVRADLDQLRDVLRKRRLRAHERVVEGLRSERFTSLLDGWELFLHELEFEPGGELLDAERPIGPLAGERIMKVYRRMVHMGRAIDEHSPAEAYHELRKKGKELRYLLELFGSSLYPASVVKPMIKALKALQDVLGRHQDREVQIGLLRSLSGEIAALQHGPEALVTIGVLVARLGEDARAARDQFAERFATFASTEQRALVKDTFL